MKHLYFLSFFLFSFLFSAEFSFSQTGITANLKNTKYECVGKAEKYQGPAFNCTTFNLPFSNQFTVSGKAEKIESADKKNQPQLYKPGWKLLDSVTLEAYVPAGKNIGVRLNIPRRTMEIVTPVNLCAEADSAVRKSPRWIRLRLANTLSKLSALKQKAIASVINEAKDPYIDEIAFAIAYESSEFLASSYCYPQLFADNARLLYSHDSDLKYVRIIDYGDSKTDENYYSTVKYTKIDKDSHLVEIEVPMDIYYMYIVHPKTSDEYETYVDPFVVETYDNSDHHWNIKAPPTGVFWRDFLYRYTEKNLNDTTGAFYPILSDSMKTCNILWDETNKERQAVRTITQWIKSVMNFTSKTERPHQPNRIYALHIGRCGEHEDLTNAAARSCLIPCRGIEAYSSDHVWNEFWDEKWWQWEPVNVSHKDPLVYEKGWGKKFGSLIARRSDGAVEYVTSIYSEHPCTISVVALDSKSRPVDGATVLLAVKGTLDETSIFIDNYGITDNQGKCTFVVSSDRTYYARVMSSIGNFPAANNQVVSLVENPATGSDNTYQLKIGASKPILYPDSIPVPAIGTDEFHVVIKSRVTGQSKKWDILFNDLNGSHTTYEGPSGIMDFYMADEENFNQGSGISTYKVFNQAKDRTEFEQQIQVPNDGKVYYAWFKNMNCINNYIIVSASFALFAEPSVGVNESISANNQVYKCWPNPFNKDVNISFIQPEPCFVGAVIYDAGGMAVRDLSGNFDAGEQSLKWDGLDSSGNPAEQGVYFCYISRGSDKSCIKLMLIR